MASWSSRVAGGASLGSSGGLLYIPGTAMVTSAQLTPVGPVAVPTTVPTVGLPAAAVDRHGLVISSVPTRIAATAAMAPTNMSERRRRPDAGCSTPA